MAYIVTVTQLSSVAAAQKNYIDTKDSDLRNLITENIETCNDKINAEKKALETAITNIKMPSAATAEEIQEIKSIFDLPED